MGDRKTGTGFSSILSSRQSWTEGLVNPGDHRTAAPLIPQKAWQGKANIVFQQRGDRTVPQIRTQAPLKVQRPFYPEGPSICQSVLLHTAGGMVGGDCLDYTIYLTAQTQALVTTAAAAKIYSDHPQPAQIRGARCDRELKFGMTAS